MSLDQIDKIIKEHDEELQYVHNMFNDEIKQIKEEYNTRITNLEMMISENETRQFNVQKLLMTTINKLNLKY
jgi:hypothetical protein